MLSIFKNFFNNSNEIHLLNLDIEGFEIDILEDFFDCNTFPWVVCVEELGQTAETLKNNEIFQLMEKMVICLAQELFYQVFIF